MVLTYIGLGGNVGNAEHTLRAALVVLRSMPQCNVRQTSRFYRTPAWGKQDQPDFINAVVALETDFDAAALLNALLGIERAFGRDRAVETHQWGPRVLDLDLLLYGDEVIEQPGLRIPHPHLHERGFVLMPLLEIAPDLEIPGLGSAQIAFSALAAGDKQFQALG